MASKRTLLSILLLMLFPLSLSHIALAEDDVQEISVLFGAPLNGDFGTDEFNIAHYAALVDRIRTESPAPLYVGTGDDLGSSILSYTTYGEHMIAALNVMGMAANTYGNREFDYGPERLLERIEESAFTWVSANVLDRHMGDVFGAAQGARRFILVDVAGVTVGLTGVAPHDLPGMTAVGPDIEVIDPIEALTTVIPALRDAGAQIVIVLSHERPTYSRAIAESIPGIDLILGDHTAEALDEAEAVGGTLLASAGAGLTHLGEFRLTIEGGAVSSWEYILHDVASIVEADTLPPHTAVQAVVAHYTEELRNTLGVVVGHTETPWDTRHSAIRTSESAIGSFVADLLREWGDADIGLINGGNLRGNRVYGPGDITYGDTLALFPFASSTVILRMQGSLLLEVLEHSVSTAEMAHGRFLQVSGLTFAFDSAAPAGSRIIEARVAGEPFEPDAMYTVATTSFLASGGDGFEQFLEAEVLVPAEEGIEIISLLLGALAEGPIAPKLEGRITDISGPLFTE